MGRKEIVAMILAGGQGSRLGVLTKDIAKPAVPFGGKYRIIDFPLSNCSNSGIYTVGVLTQYKPLDLNAYIGIGDPWDLDRRNGGVTILPPYQGEKGGAWYKGTANAIYQNIQFIDRYEPEYVLILSGDHIYKMDYYKMLDFHKSHNADATIAVINVPLDEASRFGIMNTNEDSTIYEFEEKPKNPKSNLASMGIYIFNYDVLKKALIEDAELDTSHDFGKNIIPTLLDEGKKIFAYPFSGYWKDVGTIDSLWQANMDLLVEENPLNLGDETWKIFTEDVPTSPQFIGKTAKIKSCYINQGCVINGTVTNSVLFRDVNIEEGATVIDSVIMPNVKVCKGAVVNKCIVAEGLTIKENMELGNKEEVELVASLEGK